MTKHHHHNDPWPVWKIATIAALAVVAGAGLLWLSLHISPPPKPVATAPASPNSPANPQSPQAVTHILLLFALLSWTTALVFIGLLARKLYLRIPAWKRRQLFSRAK